MRIPSIEEYLEKNRHTPENEKLALQGFWHYPSKGEYPPKEGRYLVLAKDINGNPFHDIGIYFPKFKEWDLFYRNIYAWMQLPEPPKEEA